MVVKCNICEKKFNYNWQLKRHNDRKYKCKISEEVDERRTNELERKVENINNELNETKIAVDQIKESLDNKDLMCMYCHNTFNTSHNLKRHKCAKKKSVFHLYRLKVDLLMISYFESSGYN